MSVTNYELAEQDYIAGMKYKEIAEKYNVSINTVKSWKTRYGWQKSVHTNDKKVCTQKRDYSVVRKEAAVTEVEDVLENMDLTDKQQLFCLYFIKCFNATKAYQKAYGCSYNTAAVEGCRLLKNPKIKDLIRTMKQERFTKDYLTQEDIFQKYMDIAFSDVGDYVRFGRKQMPQWREENGEYVPVIDPNTGKQKIIEYNYIDLKESEEIDTSILTEVSDGKSGIKVKMQDQLKALEWLSTHMDMATLEQRAKIDLLRAQKDKIQQPDNEGEDESVVIINDV
nr:MAG TPA: Terminase small subunit [Caudoviricetes sp.]